MSLNIVFHDFNLQAAAGERRTRASKPKVRTGCRTCKKRRVKCDETRPACKRCSRFGFACSGYDFNERPSLRTADFKATAGHPRYLPLLTLEDFNVAKVFEDQQEYQYFRHFRDATVFELSGFSGFDPTIWNQIVLQACDHEPSLRRILMAVSALSKANQQRNIGVSHQSYAFKQYGRGLQGIQDIISTRQDDTSTRIALIASLMIFCFEMQHGDPDLAVKHIQSALGLLKKKLDASIGTLSHIRHRSPIPSLEYELVAAFIRVDHHLLAKMDSDSPAKANVLPDTFLKEPYTIPNSFTSLTEARDYFYEYYHDHVLRHIPEELLGGVESSLLPKCPSVEAEYFKPSATYFNFEKAMNKWNAAFAPLLAECTADIECEYFVPASICQMQSLLATIIGRQLHWPEGLLSDDITTTCREIVEIGKIVVPDIRLPKTFGFETGVILPLFLVVVICRDITIRKDALRVLRMAGTRRESVWDSAKCVEAGEQILKVEYGDGDIDELAGEECAEEALISSDIVSCQR